MGFDQVKRIYIFSTVVCLVGAIYLGSVVDLLRRILLVQPDFVPAILVWSWFTLSPAWNAFLSLWAGICVAGVSQTPFLATFLPLAVCSLTVCNYRSLLLSENVTTQMVVGGVGAAAVTLMRSLMLELTGVRIGMGLLLMWQVVINTIGCALLAPLFCRMYRAVASVLSYRMEARSAFRTDREIKRGRT